MQYSQSFDNQTIELKQYTQRKKVHLNKRYVKKWSLAMNLRQADTHKNIFLSNWFASN